MLEELGDGVRGVVRVSGSMVMVCVLGWLGRG